MDFAELATFYGKIVGKDSSVFNQKNYLVKLNNFIYSLKDLSIKLRGNEGKINVEKVVSLLDKIEAKDIESKDASVFLKDMFSIPIFDKVFSLKEFKSFKNATPIYASPIYSSAK